MVRLKVISSVYAKTVKLLFQFHYGTIKSPALNPMPKRLFLFQFHYGTIKSRRLERQQKRVFIFQFHYGTIKRIRYPKPARDCGYFNSTMVRLKVSLITYVRRVIAFQFHYGTIKSFKCFFRKFLLLLFQFHYGTIKSPCLYKNAGEVVYFNSTMVRLKEYLNSKKREHFYPFQFHYGTIKSTHRITPTAHVCLLFQFHYGTIKRGD